MMYLRDRLIDRLEVEALGLDRPEDPEPTEGESPEPPETPGGPPGTRTLNQRVKSPLLYH